MKHYKIKSVRPQFDTPVTTRQAKNNAITQIIFTAVMTIIVILAIGMVGNMDKKDAQTLQARDVYNVCMQAHNQANGLSEQACGNAQDETGTEFLCNNNNTQCWVEVKGN